MAQERAARDLFALDDEKRILQLELQSAQQQVDHLKYQLGAVHSQLRAQENSPSLPSTDSAEQHRQYDALLVQENDDLRHKIAILEDQREKQLHENRLHREEAGGLVQERQVSVCQKKRPHSNGEAESSLIVREGARGG